MCDGYWILKQIRIYSKCQVGTEYGYEYINGLIFGGIQIWILSFEASEWCFCILGDVKE